MGGWNSFWETQPSLTNHQPAVNQSLIFACVIRSRDHLSAKKPVFPCHCMTVNILYSWESPRKAWGHQNKSFHALFVDKFILKGRHEIFAFRFFHKSLTLVIRTGSGFSSIP